MILQLDSHTVAESRPRPIAEPAPTALHEALARSRHHCARSRRD